jgi:hypothetical protein
MHAEMVHREERRPQLHAQRVDHDRGLLAQEQAARQRLYELRQREAAMKAEEMQQKETRLYAAGVAKARRAAREQWRESTLPMLWDTPI